jgi:hypothetical protein
MAITDCGHGRTLNVDEKNRETNLSDLLQWMRDPEQPSSSSRPLHGLSDTG